jgi:hypothetical protein
MGKIECLPDIETWWRGGVNMKGGGYVMIERKKERKKGKTEERLCTVREREGGGLVCDTVNRIEKKQRRECWRPLKS